VGRTPEKEKVQLYGKAALRQGDRRRKVLRKKRVAAKKEGEQVFIGLMHKERTEKCLLCEKGADLLRNGP